MDKPSKSMLLVIIAVGSLSISVLEIVGIRVLESIAKIILLREVVTIYGGIKSAIINPNPSIFWFCYNSSALPTYNNIFNTKY